MLGTKELQTKILDLFNDYGVDDFLISIDLLHPKIKGLASYDLAKELESISFDRLIPLPNYEQDILECVKLIKILKKTGDDDVILSHSSRKDIKATLSNKELKGYIMKCLHKWLEYLKEQLSDSDIDFWLSKAYADGELEMIEDYCKSAIHNKDKFTKKGGAYGKIADYIANLMMNNETYSKLGVTKQYCFVYDAMSIAEIVDHEGLSNKDKYDKVKFWLEQYEKDKNK